MSLKWLRRLDRDLSIFKNLRLLVNSTRLLVSLKKLFKPLLIAKSLKKLWNVFAMCVPQKCNKYWSRKFNSTKKLCILMKAKSINWLSLAICKDLKCLLLVVNGKNVFPSLRSKALISWTPTWWSIRMLCFNKVNLKNWLVRWLAIILLLFNSCLRFTKLLL